MNDKYMDLVPGKDKESYTLYKNGKLVFKPWSSHQPVLIHMLNTITDGIVMELGVGDHSTCIMHTICGEQKRKLLSIENSALWFKKFVKYMTPDHEMFLFKTHRLLDRYYGFFDWRFAIIFVDANPVNMRQPFIESMKGQADYMIVHDTEEPLYNYNFSSFKHVIHFPDVIPRTTILSDLDEINKDILEIF